jgi:hypothetical protein
MSRWLWALLAGVVLVAIAAAFWIDQTSVLPPVLPSPTAVAPTPAPTAEKAAPSAPSSPSSPAAQEAAAPPAPASTAAAPNPAPDAGRQTAPPPAPAPLPGALPAPPVVAQEPPPASASTAAAPNPAPDAGRQTASQTAPAPTPKTPSSPPVVAQEPPPASAPLAEPPLPPPAPGQETQEVAGVFAPKNLAQLVGAWAYSEGDCERLFQRRGGGWAFRQPVDKFAQAAIVESPKKILLPSAICRIEGASSVEGMLKVSADCEDSISYTPRSVMIALRSATELIYSASGDAALATTLKKCTP